MDRSRSMFATLAIAGLAGFVLLVAALHVIEPELAGLNHTISEFVLGKYGVLMTAAFLAGSIGSLALAWVAWSSMARVGAVFLAVWGVGLFASALLVTDPAGTTDATATSHGQLHNLIGGVSFLACGVGLVLVGLRARKWPAWAGRGTTVAACGAIGLAAVVTLFLPINIPEGGLQRIMVLAFLAGLLLFASWSRTRSVTTPTKTI